MMMKKGRRGRKERKEREEGRMEYVIEEGWKR